MIQEFLGASYFYYALSEAFLSKDLYHLYQTCKNLVESDYREQALEVLKFIDNRRLEIELQEIPEDTFLESTYRELEQNQLFMAYKSMGYELEADCKPDHLGIELKLLALLCADGNLKNQYRLIHLRLSWLKNLRERLRAMEALGCLSVVELLERFLRDHKSFLFSQLKEGYSEEDQKRDQ